MSTTPEKIHVVTLGCSKNTVDSEALLGQLRLNDAVLAADVDDADTIVINTCGFIEAAKQESINAILEAVERKRSGAARRVVVMGCLSERYKDDLRTEIPDVDAYFGSNELGNVLTGLGIDYRKELVGERMLTTPSHYAYMKVSEGCDHPCSFCAIPLMRGGNRSRHPEEVLNEAHRLVRSGVRELVLIGQDTTAYGTDTAGRQTLPDLLQRLSDIEGLRWIRLMYAYPARFPLAVLDVMRDRPNICPYIDMPVQHASDRVLRSMRRGITARATRELIARMQQTVPDLALRTTLIVGYPGETDKDVDTLLDFVREVRFHRLGVFPYSQEDGTAAYDLGDPVPADEKQRRIDAVMTLQREISEERNASLIGTECEVLIDSSGPGTSVGRTVWDAPEIDQEVTVAHETPLQPGNFYTVRVTDATEYDLSAELVRTGREVAA